MKKFFLFFIFLIVSCIQMYAQDNIDFKNPSVELIRNWCSYYGYYFYGEHSTSVPDEMVAVLSKTLGFGGQKKKSLSAKEEKIWRKYYNLWIETIEKRREAARKSHLQAISVSDLSSSKYYKLLEKLLLLKKENYVCEDLNFIELRFPEIDRNDLVRYYMNNAKSPKSIFTICDSMKIIRNIDYYKWMLCSKEDLVECIFSELDIPARFKAFDNTNYNLLELYERLNNLQGNHYLRDFEILYDSVYNYMESGDWISYYLGHNKAFCDRVEALKAELVKDAPSLNKPIVISQANHYYFPIKRINGKLVVDGICWVHEVTKQSSYTDISHYWPSTYDLKLTAKVVNGKVVDKWLDGEIRYWGLEAKYDLKQSFIENGIRAANSKIVITRRIPFKHSRAIDRYSIFWGGLLGYISNVYQHAGVNNSDKEYPIRNAASLFLFGKDNAFDELRNRIEPVKVY